MLAEIQDSQNQLANQASLEEATGQISLLDLAEILDQHKIWVETGGPGACFAFYLPKHRASYDTISAASRVPGLAKLRPKHAEPEEL